MDLYQQREQEISDNLKKDYELLKKLEDRLRYEDEPKKQEKFSQEIKDIDMKINERKNQLSKLNNEKRQKEREGIAREMPSVTFDELEVVTGFILGMQPAAPETNFSLTDITQKISKNHLTKEVHSLITMGMGKVKDVGRFIEHNAVLRPEFPDKLTAGFLMEYQNLLKKGITGDDLFESLRQFSCGNSSDFRKAAAGLAVLSYFFEKCEVFER